MGACYQMEAHPTCGMEAARGAVTAWQNQFDGIILNVAKDTGVPAHLLKNLFAIESQFWPGRSLRNDIGLGQLTEKGCRHSTCCGILHSSISSVHWSWIQQNAARDICI